MEKIPVRHIHIALKEPDFSGSFNIRDVRELLGGRDMVQELHRHDFFYILALKKGKGNHEIDFTSYEVSDNAVFFMRPGQVHQLVLKAGSTGYLIGFKTDFYAPQNKVSNQVFRKASHVDHYTMDANQFKKIHSLLADIFEEYTGKREGFQQVIKANLSIFFIGLVRLNNESPSDNANPYPQERLEKLLELLETDIYNHKEVSYYADSLNLSTYQLNAITKATLGKTCSELINERIILESKRYLLATTNQVNQVAYHLGYEDVSYFIRFFKKHTGYSPEAFRNNSR